jgi:hypothetical protein
MIRFTRTDLTFLHKTLFAKKRNSAKIVTAAIMASNLTTSTHHHSSVTNSPVLIVETSIIAVGFKSKRGRIFVGMY